MATGPLQDIQQKTGNAPVIKMGQTADNADGVWPDAEIIGRTHPAHDALPNN